MKFTFLSIAILVLASCSEFNKRRNDETWATGKPGQVLVVCTDELWQSSELDSFFVKISPAEEPYYPYEYAFNLIHKNVAGFNNSFRSTRNILIIERHNNAKYSPAKVQFNKDKWVRGQMVIEVFFKDMKDLVALTSTDLTSITQAFEDAELNRLLNHYASKRNKTIQSRIKEKYGIELDFPLGVEIINDKDDFLRIDIPDRSREMPLDGGKTQTSKANFILSYVLMWQKDYSQPEDFSPEALLQHQDSVLKKYAPHEKEGAYLATEYDPLVFPLPTKMNIGNFEMIEIKGQYRIGGRSDVFMGGPFVSYSLINPSTNKIITLFGMVHGPSERLLNYIREHKALIRSIK